MHIKTDDSFAAISSLYNVAVTFHGDGRVEVGRDATATDLREYAAHLRNEANLVMEEKDARFLFVLAAFVDAFAKGL